MYKKLIYRYGDSLIYNLYQGSLEKTYLQGVMNFEKEGKIRLAKEGYDLKFLIKRINMNKFVDIHNIFTFDFDLKDDNNQALEMLRKEYFKKK